MEGRGLIGLWRGCVLLLHGVRGGFVLAFCVDFGGISVSIRANFDDLILEIIEIEDREYER